MFSFLKKIVCLSAAFVAVDAVATVSFTIKNMTDDEKPIVVEQVNSMLSRADEIFFVMGEDENKSRFVGNLLIVGGLGSVRRAVVIEAQQPPHMPTIPFVPVSVYAEQPAYLHNFFSIADRFTSIDIVVQGRNESEILHLSTDEGIALKIAFEKVPNAGLDRRRSAQYTTVYEQIGQVEDREQLRKNQFLNEARKVKNMLKATLKPIEFRVVGRCQRSDERTEFFAAHCDVCATLNLLSMTNGNPTMANLVLGLKSRDRAQTVSDLRYRPMVGWNFASNWSTDPDSLIRPALRQMLLSFAFDYGVTPKSFKEVLAGFRRFSPVSSAEAEWNKLKLKLENYFKLAADKVHNEPISQKPI
ncbi:MAG: hypothetical protein LBI30_04215 [Holosporales bacterium]|jgi:hypothetical protein|nr:hypothetical protein [Holosporales bacterium]